MRILAVSDLHYALRQFDWISEHLEDFDLLVMAGDLLDLGSAVEPDIQEVVVEKYLRKFASRRVLLTASGNHDIEDASGDGERAARWMESLKSPKLMPDYASFEIGDILFTVCPWWEGPATRARAEQLLALDSSKLKKTWIWLHHNPPLGTPVAWTGRGDGGDPVALTWIQRFQPDFVFSGHIHNAPFYAAGGWHARIGRSVVFNAGKQPGPIPTHITLDLEKRRARWSSLEADETLDL